MTTEPSAKKLATSQANGIGSGSTTGGGGNILMLKDLAFYSLFANFPANQYWHLLQELELVRARIPILVKEPLFQKGIKRLQLGECPSLTDEELRSITALKNLESLDVSYDDHLKSDRLFYINQLTNLKELRLSHCTKFAPGLNYLTNINLTVLEVSFCEIEDPIMFTIGRMTSLQYLNISCNRLTDEGTTQIANLINLKDLSLQMNPLITDNTLKSIASLRKLEHVNINFCKLITSAGIEELSIALRPVLRQLDMIGCDRALTDAKVRPLILLAEDSKVQARMIGMVLSRYNFDVQYATDGEKALEMFRENPKYDLILMDIVMPVMDGIQCVRHIREYEAIHNLKRTPIIIQTAGGDSQKASAEEAGCDAILPKPLDHSAIALAKQLMEERGKSVVHTSRV
eukprot:TRINITY_DN9278_c0_g1_i1.p1 TRINITY_DN9278_c0_g1~~TRINITY_DN9278_c0_g1_i1.p1  ORF type:complete len:402 (-),score=89.21 TRINITY_DN9278_c0_g1_i1:140-1345(-)